MSSAFTTGEPQTLLQKMVNQRELIVGRNEQILLNEDVSAGVREP